MSTYNPVKSLLKNRGFVQFSLNANTKWTSMQILLIGTIAAFLLFAVLAYVECRRLSLPSTIRKHLYLRFLMAALIISIVVVMIDTIIRPKGIRTAFLVFSPIAILVISELILFLTTASKSKLRKAQRLRFALTAISGLSIVLMLIIPSVRYNFGIILTLGIIVIVGLLANVVLWLR